MISVGRQRRATARWNSSDLFHSIVLLSLLALLSVLVGQVVLGSSGFWLALPMIGFFAAVESRPHPEEWRSLSPSLQWIRTPRFGFVAGTS